MKQVDLTFGIPVYNAEKYIKELIDCFKKTNKFTYEIIIVNDGSKDNSLNICNKLKNKKLKIISQENGGVSSARNKIIDNAKGKWITFIDSDDLIDFNKYEKIFEKANSSKYDYYFGIRNKKYLNSNTKKIHYLIEHELINSPIDKFYKVEVLNKYHIRFNSRFSLGEDLLFNLNYIKVTNNIKYYYSDNMYIIRNVNNNSLTNKYRKDKFNDLMKVNKECKKIFKEEKILKALEYIKVKNCLSCVKDILKDKDKSNKEKKNYIINLKRKTRKKYYILNTIFTTTIYNIWYLCPSNLLKNTLYLAHKIRGSL